jgi:hypothetical protein
MRRTPSFLLLLTIASVLTPALALAQMTPAPEPTSRATMTGATTGNGRGFGLGAVELLLAGNSPAPNILMTWGDWHGRFHVDGLFGLVSTGGRSGGGNAPTGNTAFDLGVRGWYHVHAASAADFSVGGGFALVSWKAPPPGSRQYDFELELGSQMRVFIVPNVALLGSLGMGIYFPDSGSTTVSFSGSLVGSAGVAYYFM